MIRSRHPTLSALICRRGIRLLFLGVLAVTLHALAGTGLMSAGARGDVRFAAEVCTSHGVVIGTPMRAMDGSSPPDTPSHDCCKLCAGGGPLLTAGLAPGVPPAPTFADFHDMRAAAEPTPAVRALHPPRGPPVRA